MKRKLFIKKPFNLRITEFEAHLKFLIEAINKSKSDYIYYKQVAAELRVLVADKNQKNQLMLSIIREMGLSLNLPRPNISLLGKWSILENKKCIEVEDINIHDYCNKGFGAVLNGRSYTINELIRIIAQQEGSSHESSELHVDLVIGNSGNIYMLNCIARNVARSGLTLLKKLIEDENYIPRFDWSKNIK